MMLAGDFFALSSATENVRASSKPNVWQIGNLTIAGIVLGCCDLVFCVGGMEIRSFTTKICSLFLMTGRVCVGS